MSRKPYTHVKPIQGRGHLLSISTDGPHTQWLGMPEYYVHTLTIDSQEYAYFSASQKLEFELGTYVCFRYRQSKKGFYIEKKSLGIAIDPAEYLSQMEQSGD
jgi:hypothetical protein